MSFIALLCFVSCVAVSLKECAAADACLLQHTYQVQQDHGRQRAPSYRSLSDRVRERAEERFSSDSVVRFNSTQGVGGRLAKLMPSPMTGYYSATPMKMVKLERDENDITVVADANSVIAEQRGDFIKFLFDNGRALWASTTGMLYEEAVDPETSREIFLEVDYLEGRFANPSVLDPDSAMMADAPQIGILDDRIHHGHSEVDVDMLMTDGNLTFEVEVLINETWFFTGFQGRVGMALVKTGPSRMISLENATDWAGAPDVEIATVELQDFLLTFMDHKAAAFVHEGTSAAATHYAGLSSDTGLSTIAASFIQSTRTSSSERQLLTKRSTSHFAPIYRKHFEELRKKEPKRKGWAKFWHDHPAAGGTAMAVGIAATTAATFGIGDAMLARMFGWSAEVATMGADAGGVAARGFGAVEEVPRIQIVPNEPFPNVIGRAGRESARAVSRADAAMRPIPSLTNRHVASSLIDTAFGLTGSHMCALGQYNPGRLVPATSCACDFGGVVFPIARGVARASGVTTPPYATVPWRAYELGKPWGDFLAAGKTVAWANGKEFSWKQCGLR